MNTLVSIPSLTIKTAPPTSCEAATRTDFSTVRYAQCWEDADVLLDGLAIQPGDVCLSIASAGDNALAMLTRHPARVVAIDLSPAQLACLALRVAAYRRLQHGELLELIGSRPSNRRATLYAHCRPALDAATRTFWDTRPHLIARGIGEAGKFERYFRLFRRWVLPLAHTPERVARLLHGGPFEERRTFYDDVWNNRRWRLLFRLFFSRFVMGRLGRSPGFFEYVEGTVADRILARTRHAVINLDPSENPYLQWILTGHHTTALPLALREEHFETIRANLGRLAWHQASLETYLAAQPDAVFDRFNLSDIFEYMDEAAYHHLLEHIVRTGRRDGRLVYWNLFVPRSRPLHMADQIRPLPGVAARLHAQDHAFFYNRLVVETVC